MVTTSLIFTDIVVFLICKLHTSHAILLMTPSISIFCWEVSISDESNYVLNVEAEISVGGGGAGLHLPLPLPTMHVPMKG